jgi:hypothetical protein
MISMVFIIASILCTVVLFTLWLHDNPPEVRSYADPALFMWVVLPLVLLFIGIVTKSNGKYSKKFQVTRNIVCILLAVSLAAIIFMFIAASSL